ncbi:hypothetical protein M3Y99_00707500 [Aphelenchoides fujianensis]|nr:hypothetical protein M3Y99_00707500 [Aphelenchoides fujianensis]
MSLSTSLMTGGFGRLLAAVARFHALITTLCLFAPFLYLSIAAWPGFVEHTRISENALLPGLVDEKWANQADVHRVLQELKATEGEKNNQKRGQIVFEQLEQFGLEDYRQEFHSNLSHVSGTNVVGVVRAVRATPGEAILLAVRLAADQHHAIAVALSLARHSKNQNYWARDLIFLFVDGADANSGTLAWLQAYNGEEPNKYLHAAPLPTHSGTIVGGIVLDLSMPEFTHFQIQYLGVNGLLPNLDVFNLFVRLCDKHGVTSIIQHHHGRGKYANVEILWRGVFAQAFNEVEGIHSVLNHYRIHSVTLKAARNRQYRAQSTDAAAHVLEAGLRSLNNILEKLHQSYFFYLLVNPNHFLSIAYFFPALAIQTLPFLLQQYRAFAAIRGFDTPLIAWATTQLWALGVYFAHVLLYEWLQRPDVRLVEPFASWSESQWSIAVLAFNVVWPIVFASKIYSHAESAIIRCLFFNGLTVVLLCVGLLNISTGLYLGFYLLVSHSVTRMFPWNNFATRTIYGLLMNPIVFYTATVVLAAHFQLWPHELGRVGIKDLSNLERVAVFVGREGRRFLTAHLQHNTCNFLLFAFVGQISHTIFISLVGWEFCKPDEIAVATDAKKEQLEEKKKR